MQTGFRLDIAVPSTQVASAFTKSYTQSDHAVQSIEVELKKEKGRISYLTASIQDPGFKVLSQLPDPAFADIPVALYMIEPGSTLAPKLVFDGKMTAIPFSWPEPHIQIVAHDKSIDARRKAKYRTFKGMTSVQVMKKIAADYGLTVDSSALGDVSLVARTISIGAPAIGHAYMSDWEHMVKEAMADGLTLHVHGSKVIVQQFPTTLYPVTFRPGDGHVRSLNGRIEHVRGPGGMGNAKGPVSLENSGTEAAVKNANAQAEANRAKGGDGRTHVRPAAGPATDTKGAHTEDLKGARWTNTVTQRRGRKDTMTVELNPMPSIMLTHVLNFSGWGAKVDGNWEVASVKHVLAPGSGGSATSVSLERGTSKGAAKQAGTVAFEYAGVK